MSDPAIVPWGLSWIGLAVAVSGAVLAVRAAAQRRQIVAHVGWAVFVLGALTMLYPPFFNGTMFIARAIIEQIQPKTPTENPDHMVGASFYFFARSLIVSP